MIFEMRRYVRFDEQRNIVFILRILLVFFFGDFTIVITTFGSCIVRIWRNE